MSEAVFGAVDMFLLCGAHLGPHLSLCNGISAKYKTVDKKINEQSNHDDQSFLTNPTPGVLNLHQSYLKYSLLCNSCSLVTGLVLLILPTASLFLKLSARHSGVISNPSCYRSSRSHGYGLLLQAATLLSVQGEGCF